VSRRRTSRRTPRWSPGRVATSVSGRSRSCASPARHAASTAGCPPTSRSATTVCARARAMTACSSSRPAVAGCRRAGRPGGGPCSCTRPGRGAAGGSVTWPTCGRCGSGRSGSARGSCSSTRCTRWGRRCPRRPAPTCRRPGATAIRCTCGWRRSPAPTGSTSPTLPAPGGPSTTTGWSTATGGGGSSARRSSGSSPPGRARTPPSADGATSRAARWRSSRPGARSPTSTARTGWTGGPRCGTPAGTRSPRSPRSTPTGSPSTPGCSGCSTSSCARPAAT
jgi:hypothetical protein